MVTVINTVPTDANNSLVRFAHVRNYAAAGPLWAPLRPLLDHVARLAMEAVLREDKDVLDRLMMPARDVSSRSDKPQLAFRSLRKQWLQLGYGVPPSPAAARNVHSGGAASAAAGLVGAALLQSDDAIGDL